MDFIKKVYAKKSEIVDEVIKLWSDTYHIQPEDIKSLNWYLSSLRSDLYVLMEYPYVDKVYRDTYYNYYSTKHFEYSRKCIRISIFSREFNEEQFRNVDEFNLIQESYFGFFVIRPIPMHLWGRCMLSPLAFPNHKEFICCLSNIKSSINSLKLKIAVFPHTSQDQETHSCAETTIWSIMEYFGNRYPDYKPILPSHIIDVLSPSAFERQMPSHGLTSVQISFALKRFDFGVRLFDSQVSDNDNPLPGITLRNDFHRVIAYYIESGIPVIGSIVNHSQGHAIILIGRNEDIKNGINSISPLCTITSKTNNNISVYDTADLPRKYIIVDDNYAPYQQAELNNITSYYSDPAFAGMRMVNIIVPIYHKIYTEPQNIRKIVLNLIRDSKINFGTNEIVIRLLLSSCSSYKNFLVMDKSFDSQLKDLILDTPMPKFIWIVEISDKATFANDQAIGLLVFDATELYSNNSLLFVIQPTKQVFRASQNDFETKIKVSNFNIYKNNLKGEWNQWQP